MRKRITPEEKVAMRMSEMISNLGLDIELVGEYLAELSPRVAINRIILMAEVAKEEMENNGYHSL